MQKVRSVIILHVPPSQRIILSIQYERTTMKVQSFVSKSDRGFFLANFNILDHKGKCTQHVVEVNDANASNVFPKELFKQALRSSQSTFDFTFCADDETSGVQSECSHLRISMSKRQLKITSLYQNQITTTVVTIPTALPRRAQIEHATLHVIDRLDEAADEWFGKCFESMCDD